jgi:hypothetical protein
MSGLVDVVDAVDTAHRRIAGRAEVLARLFELLSETTPRKGASLIVDFGGHRDHLFFAGLQGIAREICEAADALDKANDDLDALLQANRRSA